MPEVIKTKKSLAEKAVDEWLASRKYYSEPTSEPLLWIVAYDRNPIKLASSPYGYKTPQDAKRKADQQVKSETRNIISSLNRQMSALASYRKYQKNLDNFQPREYNATN